MTLRVEMEEPSLAWTVSMVETGRLRLMNWISPRLPFWTWKSSRLLGVREWIARRLLGMGDDLKLSGLMPSGHFGILMPQRIYLITESSAMLNGLDLGEAAGAAENPKIGEYPLPARPTFGLGQAFWEIKDPEEYDRVRREVGATSS